VFAIAIVMVANFAYRHKPHLLKLLAWLVLAWFGNLGFRLAAVAPAWSPCCLFGASLLALALALAYRLSGGCRRDAQFATVEAC
jgi:hypothetical protein